MIAKTLSCMVFTIAYFVNHDAEAAATLGRTSRRHLGASDLGYYDVALVSGTRDKIKIMYTMNEDHQTVAVTFFEKGCIEGGATLSGSITEPSAPTLFDSLTFSTEQGNGFNTGFQKSLTMDLNTGFVASTGAEFFTPSTPATAVGGTAGVLEFCVRLDVVGGLDGGDDSNSDSSDEDGSDEDDSDENDSDEDDSDEDDSDEDDSDEDDSNEEDSDDEDHEDEEDSGRGALPDGSVILGPAPAEPASLAFTEVDIKVVYKVDGSISANASAKKALTHDADDLGVTVGLSSAFCPGSAVPPFNQDTGFQLCVTVDTIDADDNFRLDECSLTVIQGGVTWNALNGVRSNARVNPFASIENMNTESVTIAFDSLPPFYFNNYDPTSDGDGLSPVTFSGSCVVVFDTSPPQRDDRSLLDEEKNNHFDFIRFQQLFEMESVELALGSDSSDVPLMNDRTANVAVIIAVTVAALAAIMWGNRRAPTESPFVDSTTSRPNTAIPERERQI